MQRVKDKKADQVTVRRLNMSAILKLLRERGTLARADLAKELGMTRNTASNIVTELLQAGVVIETEYRREGAGRPGLLLELAPTGGFAIGAEIDISRIIVTIVDFKGKMLWEESTQTNPAQPQGEIIAMAEQLVQGALDWGAGESLKPLGIGVGLAGLVDAEAGNLTYAPTLNWKNVPLKSMWEEKFGLTVYLDNEANTAALGYYAYADLFSARNLAYLSIGVGMAAGLILEGHIFRGSGGFAGQAGHMKIRPDGEPCSCGDHGCWVTEVGFPALARKTGQPEIALEDAARLLRNNDETLWAVIDEMAEMLGLGIVNLVNLFNLDRIILGGALRPILPFMIEKVRATVDQRALRQPRRNVKIKVSGRDDDSVFGAAYLVLETIMNDPVPLVRSQR
ncbi:MAG: ROK family transcriptional regulator [Verrucomicrobia bacterium]|nr:ROK family transcriptional regulator [Verrucomicrobiota bacterium]